MLKVKLKKHRKIGSNSSQCNKVFILLLEDFHFADQNDSSSAEKARNRMGKENSLNRLFQTALMGKKGYN